MGCGNHGDFHRPWQVIEVCPWAAGCSCPKSGTMPCKGWRSEGLHKIPVMSRQVAPVGATLSFTLQSKGEGGRPCCLIIQEVAVHFRTSPPLPSHET